MDNSAMRVPAIATALCRALLEGGKMSLLLYKRDLAGAVDDLHQGLKADREDYVFALVEDAGDVAMVLITKNKTVYVNEDAREKLSELWMNNYSKNLEILIPQLASDIDACDMAINGVTVVKQPKPRKQPKGKGFAWSPHP